MFLLFTVINHIYRIVGMNKQEEVIEIYKRLRIIASSIFGSRSGLKNTSEDENSFFKLKERNKISGGWSTLCYLLKDDSDVSNYFWESIVISQISKLKHNNNLSLPDLAFLLSLAEKNNNLLQTNDSQAFLNNLKRFIIRNGLISNSSGNHIQLSGIDTEGLLINLTSEDRRILIEQAKQELLDVLLLTMGIRNPLSFQYDLEPTGKLDNTIEFLKSSGLLIIKTNNKQVAFNEDALLFLEKNSHKFANIPFLNRGISILTSLLDALDPFPNYVDVNSEIGNHEFYFDMGYGGFGKIFEIIVENHTKQDSKNIKRPIRSQPIEGLATFLFFSRGLRDLKKQLLARKSLEKKLSELLMFETPVLMKEMMTDEDLKILAKEYIDEGHPQISIDIVADLILSTNKKTIKNAASDKSSKLEFSRFSRKYLELNSAVDWLVDDERFNQVYLFKSQSSFPTEQITLDTLKKSLN